MPTTPGDDPYDDPQAETIDADATVEELREALDGLRVEIRSRFPTAPIASRVAGFLDWRNLYMSIRRRASTFGMTERSGEVDEFGLDEIARARTGACGSFHSPTEYPRRHSSCWRRERPPPPRRRDSTW